jgi:dynein heavy chain
MNIDAYLSRIHGSLTRLEDLVTKLNDIIENRIENNLKFICSTMLVELPEDQFPFNVTDFVNIQEQFVKDQSMAMDQKNLEVERAVYDLIELVDSTPMEGQQGPTKTSEEVQKALIGHYYRLMYHAILTSMKTSFNLIKKRVG